MRGGEIADETPQSKKVSANRQAIRFANRENGTMGHLGIAIAIRN
jgi:hypothetical protein